MTLPLSPKLQRVGLVLVLTLIVLWQWLRPVTYAVDEHYQRPAPPVTSSDIEQGVTRKPADNGNRLRATFVTLCRDSELINVLETVRSVEQAFNGKYHYDWVFLSEGALPSTFREATAALISGSVSYGYVPREQWSFPSFIEPERSQYKRVQLYKKDVPHSTDIPYRHRQRYLSGFLALHPLLEEYDYFWRIDAGVRLLCDINYDVFQLMKQNGKKYGFGAAKRGNDLTDPTLFTSALQYFEEGPGQPAENNNRRFIEMDNNLDVQAAGHCEFHTGWEIGDLNFFRSPEYADFFHHVDSTGGFYDEVWGVNAVRTVGLSLLLEQSEMHWFSDVGFEDKSAEFSVCPMEKEVRLANKCFCDPHKSATWNPRRYCMHKYFIVNNLERPDGWREAMNRNL